MPIKRSAAVLAGILLLMCMSTSGYGQLVGGNGSSSDQPMSTAPKDVYRDEAGSGVDEFSGAFQTSYGFGTVCTSQGLCFSLSGSYSSVLSVGSGMPLLECEELGAYWSLSVPKVRISVDAYFKYLEEDVIQEMQQNHDVTFTEGEILEEGKLYWHSPIVQIPGVINERFVLTRYESGAGEYVFYPYRSGKVVEARLKIRVISIPAKTYELLWRVLLPDGTVYEFDHTGVKRSHVHASNQRLPDDLHTAPNVKSLLANLVLPKTQFEEWHCTRILHLNQTKDIKLTYQRLGSSVDQFNEFRQSGHESLISAFFFGGVTFTWDQQIPATHFYLEQVESDIERLKLGYANLLEEMGPAAFEYYGTGTYDTGLKLDALYDKIEVIQPYPNSSLGWSRYYHGRSSKALACENPSGILNGISPKTPRGGNPYIMDLDAGGSQSKHNYAVEVLSGTAQVRFSDNLSSGNDNNSKWGNGYFVSTPTLQNTTLYPPGDLYSVSLAFNDSYAGTLLDMNVVLKRNGTKYEQTTEFAGRGSSYALRLQEAYCYAVSTNRTVYSTFQRGLKVLPHSSSVNHFFTMPPYNSLDFNGISVQLGPAGNDMNHWRTNPTIIFPNIADRFIQAYAHISQPNGQNILRSGWGYPTNFGNGYPWYMLREYYFSNFHANVGISMLDKWYNTIRGYGSCDDSGNLNRPVTTPEELRLSQMKVFRYRKLPYVVRTIRKESRRTSGTGAWWADEEYELNYVNRIVDNPWNGNSSFKRNIVTLTEIRRKGVERHMGIDDGGYYNPSAVVRSYTYSTNDKLVTVKHTSEPLANRLFYGVVLKEVGYENGKTTKVEYKAVCGDISKSESGQLLIGSTCYGGGFSYMIHTFLHAFRVTERLAPAYASTCGSEYEDLKKFGERTYAMSLVMVADKVESGEKEYVYSFEGLVHRPRAAVLTGHGFNRDKRNVPEYGFQRCRVDGPLKDEGGSAAYAKKVFSTTGATFGKLLSVEHYNTSDQKVRSEMYAYQSVQLASGLTSTATSPDFTPLLTMRTWYDVPLFLETHKSGLIAGAGEYLSVNLVNLQSVTVTDHFSHNFVKTESYEYQTGPSLTSVGMRGQGNLKSHTVTNGGTPGMVKTDYVYAWDQSVTILVNKNMLDTPLEVVVNGGEAGGRKVVYANNISGCSGCVLPRYIYSAGSEPGQSCNNVPQSGWVLEEEISAYNSYHKPVTRRRGCWSLSETYTYLSVSDLVSTRTFNGHVWTYTYHAHRQLATEVDPQGYEHKYYYNRLNQLGKHVVRSGVGGPVLYEELYDRKLSTAGGENSVTTRRAYTSGPQDETKELYDVHGRKVSELMSNYTFSGGDLQNAYDYDVLDRSKGESLPLVARGGSAVTYRDDALGYMTKSYAHGSGKEMRHEYGTNLTEIPMVSPGTYLRHELRDENNQLSFRYYDQLGNLVMIRRQALDVDYPMGGWSVTSYAYNNQLQVEQISGPTGQNYQYEYYGDRKLKKATVPGGSYRAYTYDMRGNIQTMTDGNGHIMRYEYDAMSRPYREWRDGVLGLQLMREYEYYAAGSGSATGKLKKEKIYVEDLSGFIERNYTGYDALGHLSGYTESWPDMTSVQVTLTNNVRGGVESEVSTITHSGQTASISHSYNYDAKKLRVSGEKVQINGTNTSIGTYTYNDNDWLSDKLMGGYIGQTYEHHDRGWIREINALESGGDKVALCDREEEEKFECDDEPWVVVDPKIKIDFYVIPPVIKAYKLDYTAKLYNTVTLDTTVINKKMTWSADGVPDPPPYNAQLTYNYPAVMITASNRNLVAQQFATNIKNDLWTIGTPVNQNEFVVKQIEKDIRTPVVNPCDEEEEVTTPKYNIFGQRLYYEEGLKMAKAAKRYNGDVSAMEWQILGNRPQVYGFDYDQLGRMRRAFYTEQTDAGGYTTDDKFGVTVRYKDHIGNIEQVLRRGIVDICPDGSVDIDTVDLLLYSTSGIYLTGVSESADPEVGFKGSGGSASYDANGNMTSASYAGVGSVTYNHLNQPVEMELSAGGEIRHTYDGSGRRLSTYFSDGTNDWTRTYIGNMVFLDGELEYYLHREGRVYFEGGATQQPEYFIRDHLGNVRVVVYDENDNKEIDVEDDIRMARSYYPFGMVIDSYPWNEDKAGSPENAYGYNGKERMPQGGPEWYDYGARFYDPTIGRFLQIDPLAGNFPQQTPYTYAYNNPIRFIDVYGLYGDEPTANRQRDRAIAEGLSAGDVYQSGDEWGFNVSDGKSWFSSFSKEYGSDIEMTLSQSGGVGEEDNWQQTKNGLGALGIANGAKEELINYAAKSDAAINDMRYSKAIKVMSRGVFAAQTVISGIEAYNAWEGNNSNKWGVTAKAGLDVTIGYVSLIGGPVGFAIGALYFIGDASGWWGDWGRATPTTQSNINKK